MPPQANVRAHRSAPKSRARRVRRDPRRFAPSSARSLADDLETIQRSFEELRPTSASRVRGSLEGNVDRLWTATTQGEREQSLIEAERLLAAIETDLRPSEPHGRDLS